MNSIRIQQIKPSATIEMEGTVAALKEAGVDEKQFLGMVTEMAEIAIQDKCTATNPRTISKPQMAELMKRIYYGRHA